MPVANAQLADDQRGIAWIVELMASTDDVYLRELAGAPTVHTSLRDELGLDSIGLISVFYALIDHFGVELDESHVASWRVLGDVLALARKCAPP